MFFFGEIQLVILTDDIGTEARGSVGPRMLIFRGVSQLPSTKHLGRLHMHSKLLWDSCGGETGGRRKRLTMIRHGESEYNSWRRESFKQLRFKEMIKQDPGLRYIDTHI